MAQSSLWQIVVFVLPKHHKKNDAIQRRASGRDLMQVTLIHNAKAGDEQPSRDELMAIMRDAGHEVAYHSTKDDDWNKALKEPADLIAVAGGDGTVGKVAKQLVGGQKTPIAVLPLGTANNISKTLGLADVPIDRLIKSWATAKPIAFDSAVVDTPWGSTDFIESMGIGLFASTILKAAKSSTVNQTSAEGEIVTALQMLQERLQSYPITKLDINLDGQDLSGEYILLEAMNIRYVSSNVHLAPNANVGDGFLDVILLTQGDRRKLDTYLFRRLAAKLQPQEQRSADFLSPPELPTYQGKHLQIQCQDVDIHIDDETKPGKALSSLAKPIEIDVKVSPHALEFLIPVQ
jgi:diacylglycerol kinase (ATP)